MTADRFLRLLMRVDACVVLCAVPCAFLPFEWMDRVHREWLGLGPMPDVPLVRYMTRSLSLMYALHGALVLTITVRWREYRSLVPVLAYLYVALGCGLLFADLSANLPWWWAGIEGPGMVAFGLVKLFLYRRAIRADASAL